LPRRLSNPGWFKQALLFLKKKKQKDFFILEHGCFQNPVMARLDRAIHAFSIASIP
jgi:hypothetical protein